MADAIDLKIAQIQQTAQILEKLGIPESVMRDSVGKARPADKRIEEYAKSFRALYEIIQKPQKET